MIEDYTVNVSYRNKDMVELAERIYPLKDYCQELKLSIMHILSDVENAYYELTDGQSKDDWNKETKISFSKIRHKLLDAANNIERMPSCIMYNGKRIDSINTADFIANKINELTEK